MNKRDFLILSTGISLSCLSRSSFTKNKPKVLIIGGGYGGTTAAKYLKLFTNNNVDVTLIEPNMNFISCPLSNLIIGGSKKISYITRSYDTLKKKYGINIIHDIAKSIDVSKKIVKTNQDYSLSYDKLLISPGVSLNSNEIEGLADVKSENKILHAWKAGNETIQLRKKLEEMPNGGVFAITIPMAPYRCPPGPYERACQIAWYFQKSKPKSKVLILDENPDVVSKKNLFKSVFLNNYKNIIEYRNHHKVVGVSAKENLIKFEMHEDVKANIINILPPMSSGVITKKLGLNNMANNKWCGVNFKTFESNVIENIFLIGDSIQGAEKMPKSGHMANNQAKVAAAAIVSQLFDLDVNKSPILTNTCYSFIDNNSVVHVASVHRYDESKKTFKIEKKAGGLSEKPSKLEGKYAHIWAQTIWSDMLS